MVARSRGSTWPGDLNCLSFYCCLICFVVVVGLLFVCCLNSKKGINLSGGQRICENILFACYLLVSAC